MLCKFNYVFLLKADENPYQGEKKKADENL